jgi:hypothetical protein
MEIIIVFVAVLIIATLSQALTIRSVRKNENVDIPLTWTKSIWKHWDGYLEPDIKRKYQFQYAGWVLLFISICVAAVWLLEL